jgi:hypothetical protein
MGRERRLTARHKLDVGRQQHRQLGLGNRLVAVRGTLDHRNRTAPVALPRHQPVSQAERHGLTALPALSQPGGDVLLGGFVVLPREGAGLDQRAGIGVGRGERAGRKCLSGWLDHHLDRQVVLFANSKSR